MKMRVVLLTIRTVLFFVCHVCTYPDPPALSISTGSERFILDI